MNVETARAVERAVLDYFLGWFEGDAVRMERALHPELAKRTLRSDGLESYTAAEMIEATAAGIGRTLDVVDRRIDIEITHIDRPNASVVVYSSVYVEFIHLVETEDGWKIVNTLWQRA
jgi:hypothetical protein